MKKVQSLIKELIDITYSIKKIYDELIKCQINGTIKEYNEYISLLNDCIQIENKIYQKLPVKYDNYNRYTYLSENEIESRNYPDNIKEMICNRIENHFVMKEFINPFLSISNDQLEKEDENIFTILTQYNRDYYALLIHLLNQLIITENNSYNKEKYLKSKYQTIFTVKVFENLLLNQTDNYYTESRERLILFGHNEELINEHFFKKSQMITLVNFNNLKNIKYIPFASENDREIYSYLHLINIKASLYLLEETDKKAIFLDLQKNITINDLMNNFYLEKALETIKMIASNTNEYQKIKTSNRY